MSDLGLHARRVWIFDLDGTLTVSAHDFPAIRDELRLPPEVPILEALEGMDEREATWRRRRLDEIEWDIAGRAEPATGAADLLEHLVARGRALGIVTRNSRASAIRTLATARLDGFFRPGEIVGREDSAPKPSPAGVEQLLRLHDALPHTALIVGDYRYDMLAGRSAGVACVLVDRPGGAPWSELADVVVDSLGAVRDLTLPPGNPDRDGP